MLVSTTKCREITTVLLTQNTLYSSRALTALARFAGVKRTKDHEIVHVLGKICWNTTAFHSEIK